MSTDYWVCSSRGHDSNPGTFEQPFKTITHATSIAGAKSKIKSKIFVRPGVYDPASVPKDAPGVQILGRLSPEQLEEFRRRTKLP